MKFPKIPNVEFKIIAGHKSGNRQYAISSDGKVWIGNGNKWNKVEAYQIGTGEWAVMLNYGGLLDGARMRTINELLLESFGVESS